MLHCAPLVAPPSHDGEYMPGGGRYGIGRNGGRKMRPPAAGGVVQLGSLVHRTGADVGVAFERLAFGEPREAEGIDVDV